MVGNDLGELQGRNRLLLRCHPCVAPPVLKMLSCRCKKIIQAFLCIPVVAFALTRHKFPFSAWLSVGLLFLWRLLYTSSKASRIILPLNLHFLKNSRVLFSSSFQNCLICSLSYSIVLHLFNTLPKLGIS